MKALIGAILVVLCMVGRVEPVSVWAGEAAPASEHLSRSGSVADLPSSTSEDGKRYSIFMHGAAGVFLVAIGLLAFVGGFKHPGLAWVRNLWPFLWVALGLFLFIRSDPEAWPVGPAGFWESFTIPTAHEVIQHKILSFIVVLIGVFELLMAKRALLHPGWAYFLPTLWFAAALALIVHRHLGHPHMDLANMQHVSWGIQSLLLATVRLLEDIKVLRWNHNAGIWTLFLAVLGMQIAIYTE